MGLGTFRGRTIISRQTRRCVPDDASPDATVKALLRLVGSVYWQLWGVQGRAAGQHGASAAAAGLLKCFVACGRALRCVRACARARSNLRRRPGCRNVVAASLRACVRACTRFAGVVVSSLRLRTCIHMQLDAANFCRHGCIWSDRKPATYTPFLGRRPAAVSEGTARRARSPPPGGGSESAAALVLFAYYSGYVPDTCSTFLPCMYVI